MDYLDERANLSILIWWQNNLVEQEHDFPSNTLLPGARGLI